MRTWIFVCLFLLAAISRAELQTYVSGIWTVGGGTWTPTTNWVNGNDAKFITFESFPWVTLDGGTSISVGELTFATSSVLLQGSTTLSAATVTAISESGTGSGTITTPFALAGTGTTFNPVLAANAIVVNSEIQGAGLNLTKAGAGDLTLMGTSSYSGTTSVLAGRLFLSADAPSGNVGALGNSITSVLLGNTSGASNVSLIINGPYTVSRNITVQSGNSGTITLGANNSSASATFAGAITLNKSATISKAAGGGTLSITGGISSGEAGAKTLTFANSGTVNVGTAAIVDGSGTVAVSQTGSGTTTLSATNTYTGGTTISAGALNVTGALSTDGGLTVNGGTITFSNSQAVSALTGTGGTISFPGKTLTISQASSYSGAISASAATLAKSGSGTLILSGGGSSIALGTGTLSISGNTTVNLSPTANAPFSGTSTLVSLDAGTLALGTNFSQTFGGLTLGNAGTNTIDFGGMSSAALTFGATPTGTSTVNIINYNYAADPSLSGPTIRVTGAPSGALSFFMIGSSPVTYYGSSDILVAIPEPSTYAAAAGVLALGAAVIRRRRQATAGVRTAKG